MVKITTDVDGKKYELISSGDEVCCDDCAFNKRCKHWTDAPKWDLNILCMKLWGIWKEIKDD